MKISLNLSPNEIFKLGRLTDASFKDAWCPLCHTQDDVALAIHKLINTIEIIDTATSYNGDDDNNDDDDDDDYPDWLKEA